MTAVEETAGVDAEAACRARGGTSCRAHTRAYRDGQVIEEGFAVGRISDFLQQDGVAVWLDLEQPDTADLAAIAEELGLHPLAVEDAVNEHQRPKVDRYADHLFMSSYVVALGDDTAQTEITEVAAFLTPRALVTVRKGAGLQVEPLLARWDEAPPEQVLDEVIETLEDVLFDAKPRSTELQRRSFDVRKSLVMLRRVVLPMREVVNTLMRREVGVVTPDSLPYFQDVYDHVLRASEWTEGLRDLVGTILETNLTLQSNRLDISIGKLTAYAAILAVTTAITGFYGQNVPYPGFSQPSGFVSSAVLLIGSVVGLFTLFKRKGYL